MEESNVRTDAMELEKNVKLQYFPSDLQDKAKEVVTYFWYVFYWELFLQPIQGFSFQTNTGNHTSILFKPPRSETHESKVIHKTL